MASLSKPVKLVRRKLMRALTRSVGHSSSSPKLMPADLTKIKRVLICRPNHRLGNQLLVTPLLQEVLDVFPQATIDILVKGNVMPIIVQNYPRIERIIQLPKRPLKHLGQYLSGWLSLRRKPYDLAINVVATSSSGRLSTRFARSRYKLFGDENSQLETHYEDYRHMAKSAIYQFRDWLCTSGMDRTRIPIPLMDIKLSPAELVHGKEKLNELVQDQEKKTISLYTYATGEKCYSSDWWHDFHRQLKTNFPDFNLLEILPADPVSNIDFCEPSLYSLNIREMAAVIANTSLLITADCGIMHLASAAHTPIVAFFSVTDPVMYGPYNQPSISLNTNNLSIDEIVNAVKKTIYLLTNA
jgi:ADP-heptose:LPS heptosyltransferase